MAKPFEIQKIGDVIQTLNEQIKVLKTELTAMGPVGSSSGDLAKLIENTKAENSQFKKEITQLKTEMNAINEEIRQITDERFPIDLAEILEADEVESTESTESTDDTKET